MSEERAQSKGKVLIAEDTRAVSFLMTQMLEQAGYEVDLAEDGAAALDKVRSFGPELLILDLMMPKLHGFEVLRRLRADPATRDLGVIVCTAKSFKTEYAQAVELGALAFLPKPFIPADLVGKVDSFFANLELGEAAAPAAVQHGAHYDPALDTAKGRLTLWGTRGSIPTPGPTFLRHGGNTSCMCIEHGDEWFIFDAGSGIRELGLEIMKGDSRRIHLFITHTHWDHIQGFPFFTPVYVPGFEVTVYGAEGFGKSLEQVFRGQLDQDYFPVQMEDMNATLEFRHLTERPVEIGGVSVSWQYAQHPGATVGYRIDVDGKSVAWFPDDEFLFGYVGAPDEVMPDHELLVPYRNVITFLRDVDILIHEAQYTNGEYRSKIGWGHSSVSNACLMAKLIGAKRWVVTHHDPMHDDDFLEKKLQLTKQELLRLDHPYPVIHGYDGMAELL